jgi:hypothetical protein
MDYHSPVTATFAKSQNITDELPKFLQKMSLLNQKTGLKNFQGKKTKEVLNDVSFEINSNFENKENLILKEKGLERNIIGKHIRNIDENLDDLVIIPLYLPINKNFQSSKTNI